MTVWNKSDILTNKSVFRNKNSDRNIRFFLEKWKTHCIQLLSIISICSLSEENKHSYNRLNHLNGRPRTTISPLASLCTWTTAVALKKKTARTLHRGLLESLQQVVTEPAHHLIWAAYTNLPFSTSFWMLNNGAIHTSKNKTRLT